MREIKFRGKRKNNGEWVYGFACKSAMDITGELKKPNWFIIDEYMNYYGVKPETIGQFTGLKDKNGVEIYEGDIVVYPANIIGKCEVKFGEYDNQKNYEDHVMGCGFYCESLPQQHLYWLIPLSYRYAIEVIGNIHEVQK